LWKRAHRISGAQAVYPKALGASASGTEMVVGCSTRPPVGNIRASLPKVWMTMNLACRYIAGAMVI
ncbi:MAG: hypothetical protein ABWY10_17200, partial [Tardiphaga sp.]